MSVYKREDLVCPECHKRGTLVRQVDWEYSEHFDFDLVAGKVVEKESISMFNPSRMYDPELTCTNDECQEGDIDPEAAIQATLIFGGKPE